MTIQEAIAEIDSKSDPDEWEMSSEESGHTLGSGRVYVFNNLDFEAGITKSDILANDWIVRKI